MASLTMLGDNNPSRKAGAFTAEHRQKLSKSGGKHPMYGKKHTLESKKKISEKRSTQVMKPMSDETRKKISNAHKGRKLHENTKRAVSESNKKRIGMKYNKTKLQGNDNYEK